MAKLAKKIKLNKLITADKQHMKETAGGRVKPLSVRRARAASHIDKKTDYIPKENLERIIGVARAHALWLHMDVLKHTFGFTGKQLIEYHDRLQGVLTYAIMILAEAPWRTLSMLLFMAAERKMQATWATRSMSSLFLTRMGSCMITMLTSIAAWNVACLSTSRCREHS